MGDVTVALFALLTLIGLALVAVGALRRVRILLAAGSALLIGLAGAWIIGLPGIVVGLVAFFLLVIRRR